MVRVGGTTGGVLSSDNDLRAARLMDLWHTYAAETSLNRSRRRQVPSKCAGGADHLQFGLETDLSQPVPVGRGNILYLEGWCYHPVHRVSRLAIVADGIAHNVPNHHIAHPDIGRGEAPRIDIMGFSRTSGFVAFIPLPPVETKRTLPLALRAYLSNGDIREAAVGDVVVAPYVRPALACEFPGERQQGAAGPRVAICMATYNPPIDLFEQQIVSLVAQTHTNWICIISDDCSHPDTFAAMREVVAVDSRFYLVRNSERKGFYHNFEACMALVPASAEFVSLVDQDDYWYPDKLKVTIASFTHETMLVYTDLDVVNRDGGLIHHSYWVNRRNNYKDFASLLFANTVTGAASVFRAKLLAEILPFPVRIGDAFHDHWIACVALTMGRIGYVDEPMYAYRQHAGNVIGHNTGLPSRWPKLSSLLRAATSVSFLRRKVSTILWSRRDVYLNDVMRLVLIAKTLQLRCGGAPRDKQRVLGRFASFEHTIRLLIFESVASMLRRRPTLGVEWYYTRGAIASRLITVYESRKRNKGSPCDMGSPINDTPDLDNQ